MNKNFKRIGIILLFSLLIVGNGKGETKTNFRYPIRASKDLSGDFGELRSAHFHSGIDLRSEEVEGKEVVAVQDGWISRLAISVGGYGKALYIEHPDGHTTVYGHLKRFTHKLDSVAYARQYKTKSYKINLEFPPNAYPVKRGEVIALSGNTGASGGPHLHFEVRETNTQKALNPIKYLPVSFTDSLPPIIRNILVAPVRTEGVVNGEWGYICREANFKTKGIKTDKPITAWGRIQLAIDAIDRMNGKSNTFAVPIVRLFVDNKLVSEIRIDTINFHTCRYYDGLIYYPEYAAEKNLYISSYRQPNCKIDVYRRLSSKNGSILINEERPYKIRYVVGDGKRNYTSIRFTIMGKRSKVGYSLSEKEQLLSWKEKHSLTVGDAIVEIPKESLFDDMIFIGWKEKDTIKNNPFPCYFIGDGSVALAKPIELKLPIPAQIEVPNDKIFMASIAEDKSLCFISNKQIGNKIYGKTRKWGVFTLGIDTIAPEIKPVSLSSSNILFCFSDKESGIKSFEASLDGEFLLLQPNKSYTVVSGSVPYDRFGKPKERLFRISVTDNCGNTSSYEKEVVF